ncbi:MAG TPA: tetratricopeptide repeat protein [Blastocatellia bacterium]|nr:tetratricopeptide repeat protein [Blastocatellia bacterium]
MRRSLTMIAALGFMLALYVPLTPARTAAFEAMAQDPKAEEAAAYKAWYDAHQAKDYQKAMQLAKEYLKKYPTGERADYLKKQWIPQIRAYQFNQAMQAKNTAEMIKIGNEALADDPENLDYLYLLAINIRTNELFASPPNYSHASEAMDYTQRSIRIIEGGKLPTGIDASKKDATLAVLYQNLAVIEAKNNNNDKALEYYKKSSSLDPGNTSLNAFNYLACGSLHQMKYQAAAQKYQSFPEEDRTADPPKEEVKAALDEVNAQADAVIDCWARFLGLTAKNNTYPGTRDQVLKAATDLYKYRHPDSPDGLQKLIDQYSNSAPSASAGNND